MSFTRTSGRLTFRAKAITALSRPEREQQDPVRISNTGTGSTIVTRSPAKAPWRTAYYYTLAGWAPRR